jgi:hypothetical protein
VVVRGGLDQVEREKIKKALLDYCGQATMALVISFGDGNACAPMQFGGVIYPVLFPNILYGVLSNGSYPHCHCLAQKQDRQKLQAS